MGDGPAKVATSVLKPLGQFIGVTDTAADVDVPEPPPPPPEPGGEAVEALPDPEDELLRQRKRQAAAKRRVSGRAGTLLSERDTGGTLG